MAITPEEVAKLHPMVAQGDIVPILYRVSDMADLIAKQDQLLKLADDLANSPTAEDEDALAAVVAYRTAREKLK